MEMIILEFIKEEELNKYRKTMSSKSTTLGDLVYKSKQLSGLDIVTENPNAKGSIVNMSSFHHKLLNICIQTLHNNLVNATHIYEHDGKIYSRVTLKSLIEKLGLHFSMVKNKDDSSIVELTSSSYKDIKFIIEKFLSMQGVYIKLKNSTLEEVFPLFEGIKYKNDKEEFYYCFEKRIFNSITNGYSPLDYESSKSKNSYITLNIKELHNKNITLHTMMFYEFLIAEKYSIVKHDKLYSLKTVVDYISNNNKWKPKRLINEILNPTIEQLEKEFGIKVYYFIERYLTNSRIKGLKFKVYLTDSYVDYENSKQRNSVEYPHIYEIENKDIFKLGDLSLYVKGDNCNFNIDEIPIEILNVPNKKGFENNTKGKDVITYTKSDIEENIIDEIIIDSNGNEMYESWLTDSNGMPIINGEDLWGDD